MPANTFYQTHGALLAHYFTLPVQVMNLATLDVQAPDKITESTCKFWFGLFMKTSSMNSKAWTQFLIRTEVFKIDKNMT